MKINIWYELLKAFKSFQLIEFALYIPSSDGAET